MLTHSMLPDLKKSISLHCFEKTISMDVSADAKIMGVCETNVGVGM